MRSKGPKQTATAKKRGEHEADGGRYEQNAPFKLCGRDGA